MKSFSLNICIHNQGMWCRLNGKGFSVSTTPLLFSERNGYTKVWTLGKIKFKFLEEV